ncbi:hypothetical protein PATSB16_33070 [Pandoraea thiooxydans]|nr:hypothetical protein PATSB16_33070 [Pandoraea thiooxydans]
MGVKTSCHIIPDDVFQTPYFSNPTDRFARSGPDRIGREFGRLQVAPWLSRHLHSCRLDPLIRPWG